MLASTFLFGKVFRVWRIWFVRGRSLKQIWEEVCLTHACELCKEMAQKVTIRFPIGFVSLT